MELTGNFTIDINEFEKICRNVGYLNGKMNQKINGEYPEDHDSIVSEYNQQRLVQLNAMKSMIKIYHKDPYGKD